MLRECAGERGTIMFDANQQWTLPSAREMCKELSKLKPLWIEEPTHPDDMHAHAALAREIAPVKIACGEHIPNRVVFKNFFESHAVHYVQADCTRLAGVSEFHRGGPAGEKIRPARCAARRRHGADPSASGLVPAHRAWGTSRSSWSTFRICARTLPFLRNWTAGRYRTPQEAGASTDLKDR